LLVLLLETSMEMLIVERKWTKKFIISLQNVFWTLQLLEQWHYNLKFTTAWLFGNFKINTTCSASSFSSFSISGVSCEFILLCSLNFSFQISCGDLVVIIDCLGISIVPYVALLVLPVLGRMSDQNDSVRLMATSCFASLVRLMPLDVSDSVSLSENSEIRKTVS